MTGGSGGLPECRAARAEPFHTTCLQPVNTQTHDTVNKRTHGVRKSSTVMWMYRQKPCKLNQLMLLLLSYINDKKYICLNAHEF